MKKIIKQHLSVQVVILMIMGLMIVSTSTVQALYSRLTLIGMSQSEGSISWQINTEDLSLLENDSVIYYDLLVYGDQESDINDLDSMQVKTGWTDLGLNWEETKNLISGTLIKNLNQKAGNNTENFDFYFKSIYTIFNTNGEAIADLIVVKLNNDSDYDFFNYINLETEMTKPDIYASNDTTEINNTVTVITNNVPTAMVNETRSYSASYNYSSLMVRADLIERDYSIDSEIFRVYSLGTNVVDDAFDYVEKTNVVRIIVNANGINFDEDGKNSLEKKVTSVLADGWSFTNIDEDNEFIMYEAELTYQGLYTTKLVENPSSILNADFTVDGKVTFDFSTLNKAYVIFVKTKISDDTFYEYLTAKESSDHNSNFNFHASGVTVEVNDSVSNDMSLSLLDAGQTDITSDGLYNWYLEYKPYGLEHENIEIEHYLPDNSEFLLDGNADIDTTKGVFTYTELILNSDGTYTEGDSFDIVNDLNMYYLPNIFNYIMVFELPDTNLGYKIRYSSLITSEYVEESTVYYHITDDLKSYLNKTETDYVEQKFYDLDYTIEIPAVTEQQVTDAYNAAGIVNVSSTNTVENRFTFGIYTKDTSRLIRMVVTNSQGEARVSGLAEGEYYIKQVMSDDYEISSQTFTFMVSLNDGVYTTSVDGKTGEEASYAIFDEPIVETDSANIYLLKAIYNKLVESDKEFKYTVYATGINGDYEYKGFTGKEDGTLTFVDGVAAFTLKKFEIIKFKLPLDTVFNIVPEADANGYKTTCYEVQDSNTNFELYIARALNMVVQTIVRQSRTGDDEETTSTTTSTTTSSSEVVVVANTNETQQALSQPVKKIVETKIIEEQPEEKLKEDQPKENKELDNNQVEQDIEEPVAQQAKTTSPLMGLVIGIPLLLLLLYLFIKRMMARKV